jgi:uncharacterized protein YceH (UPF0502 family)
MSDPHQAPLVSEEKKTGAPEPLNSRQRRILGVLIEKARTTPDAYPLSLNALVTGCNQKSNRNPVMDLSLEEVEDELIAMRERGIVAEVHSGGRVPKYRHYGYDYLGIKGVEAAVMTELLLRGEQTAGDIRSRASRFEPIPDLKSLQEVLDRLIQRGLVVSLTGPGRGQLFTHNLYPAGEIERIKASLASSGVSSEASRTRTHEPIIDPSELESLREEVAQLRLLVEALSDRVQRLES